MHLGIGLAEGSLSVGRELRAAGFEQAEPALDRSQPEARSSRLALF